MSDDGKLILAIDQGTTSTRALIFDQNGQVRAQAQKELPISTPHSGWVEQDAKQIWEDVVAVCRDVIAKIGIDLITGIGITNQRETTIVWDAKTGEPVYNAIVWQDRRTADFCKSLKTEEGIIQKRTGLLADPYFSATKIRWILDHIGGYREDLLFGTVDSYLLWKLTEGRVHATDITNASRTMLFNITTHEWDEDQCNLIGVPRHMLPKVHDNCHTFGQTTLFEKPLDILAMAGDQQAATFGQACFEKGMVKSTYGTGCFALMNTGEHVVISKNRLLSTIVWRINGKATYALEGSIFVAGAAIQFLRDNLKFFNHAGDSQTLAQSVADTDGVVFVPSFTGLGAPYWDPDARGAVLGLSRGTTTAHITRAVLDAQGYQTRDLMNAMVADMGSDVLKSIRVDGGLVANDYVCQQIANQTGVDIDRPSNAEATVWGVAAMAFLQAGIFKGLDDITGVYKRDKQFLPRDDIQNKESGYNDWAKAIKAIQSFAR